MNFDRLIRIAAACPRGSDSLLRGFFRPLAAALGLSLFFLGLASADTSSYTLTLLAGGPGGAGNANGTGTNARFNQPNGVAVDTSGNVYAVDTDNFIIRKITPAGVVTIFAGGADQEGSTDGTGTAARFSNPTGIAIDASGNLYVADTYDDTIRKITPAGVVTTLAGAAGVAGGGDGAGAAARFQGPQGVAVDGSGNIWVADTGNSTIRRITSSGVVTTVAGTAGQNGTNDGTGAAARFNSPQGLTVDTSGNVYVADTASSTIRMITPAGVVTTLAGSAGQAGSADGTGSAAQFDKPVGITVSYSNIVYVTDTVNHTVRSVTTAGVVTTIAGSAGQNGSSDGSGSAVRFNSPEGITVDSAGDLFLADTGNDTIREITAAGVASTLAGEAPQSGNADGSGAVARFNLPQGVAMDSTGNVFVADSSNMTIRKITPTGTVTTLAGSANQSGSNGGVGANARFTRPYGVAVDSGGNVYVTDTNDVIIRKITPDGDVTTLAGTAGQSGATDGTGAAARFSFPIGIAVDSSGNVFVSDFGNTNIRKITPAGVVTTFAGSAGGFGSADGTGTAAKFDFPQAIGIDGSNNLYVADTGNSTIRKITPAAVVTTVLGKAGVAGLQLGSGPGIINRPLGVAVSSDASTIYLSTENEIVKAAATVSPVATPSFSPAGGSYTTTQSVTITDTTANATIYYTTDGTTPTSASTQYGGAISVASSETIQAIAVVPGVGSSAVATASYTIVLPFAATPKISPAGGTYGSAQTVTITDATAGAAIHYTTDGSLPTASSTAYTGPITISSSETLTAIAVASGYANSAAAIQTYTITSVQDKGGSYGGSYDPLTLGFLALAARARRRRSKTGGC